LSNFYYDGGLEGFADGTINWADGDIHVVCVNLGMYSPTRAIALWPLSIPTPASPCPHPRAEILEEWELGFLPRRFHSAGR